MEVFELDPVDGAQLVAPAPLLGHRLARLGGVRQGDSWQPSPVELLSEENGQAFEPVDCPYLVTGLLVVKDAALPRVADLLGPDVELLPLDCPQEPLTVVNVLRIVHALDEDASTIERMPDGRILWILDYAFHADRVPEDGLFKISGYTRQLVLCSGKTARELQNRITGLNPKLLWSTA